MTSEPKQSCACSPPRRDPFGDPLLECFRKAVASLKRRELPDVFAFIRPDASLRDGYLLPPMIPCGTSVLQSRHIVAMGLRREADFDMGDVNFLARQEELSRSRRLEPYAFMYADNGVADVVVTLRTDLTPRPYEDDCTEWQFNFYYVQRDNVRGPGPRQARLDDPRAGKAADTERLPPPLTASQKDEIAMRRCNVRVLYDLATKKYAFWLDAEMRDAESASSRYMMHPLPAQVPKHFGTMQDILFVYMAYIIGEARSSVRAPIRQVVEPSTRRLLRIPSTSSQERELAEEEKGLKATRIARGLHEDDSDYDP